MKLQVDAVFWKTNERIAFVDSRNQSQIISKRLQQMWTNLRSSSKNIVVLKLKKNQFTIYNYITTQFMFRAIRESRVATFFVTNFEKIDKSFLLFALKRWLMNHNWIFAKTTSTSIATNHIDDKIIHNFFDISQKNEFSWNNFQSCVFQWDEMLEKVKNYQILIIDEISMINDELFTYLNEFLTRVHKNTYVFENIHVILFENLMQLSFVTDRQIFHASQWRLFTSMFLIKFRRHDRNSKFDKMLETIRMKNITNEIMNTLHTRWHEFDIRNLTNKSTAFMSLKKNVKRINDLMLKRCCNDVSYEHTAMNKKQKRRLWNDKHLKQFKRETNLFEFVTIVIEAKIMFLNNTMINLEISNEICGLIVDINDNEHSIVAFFKANEIEICEVVDKSNFFWFWTTNNDDHFNLELLRDLWNSIFKIAAVDTERLCVNRSQNSIFDSKRYCSESKLDDVCSRTCIYRDEQSTEVQANWDCITLSKDFQDWQRDDQRVWTFEREIRWYNSATSDINKDLIDCKCRYSIKKHISKNADRRDYSIENNSHSIFRSDTWCCSWWKTYTVYWRNSNTLCFQKLFF